MIYVEDKVMYDYGIPVFYFVEDTHKFGTTEEDLVVRLPANIEDKQHLFDILAQKLHFPYFGRNWDALNDLLNDFWWIDQKRTILLHENLPLEQDPENTRMYLEVLLTAIDSWKEDEKHEFVAVFPLASRQKIEHLRSQAC